jgi:haloalkane dehalogenase
MNSFQSSIASWTSAGATSHYADDGSGETSYCYNGNPGWCFLYRKIIAALKRDFRYIALDYPGYGTSGAPASYGFTPAEHTVVVEHFLDHSA